MVVASDPPEPKPLTLRQARVAFERDYIFDALQRNRTIGAAADELGVQRTNLYRKMRQLGIPIPVRA